MNKFKFYLYENDSRLNINLTIKTIERTNTHYIIIFNETITNYNVSINNSRLYYTVRNRKFNKSEIIIGYSKAGRFIAFESESLTVKYRFKIEDDYDKDIYLNYSPNYLNFVNKIRNRIKLDFERFL